MSKYLHFKRLFVKNLRVARETASRKKRKVELVWRGYRDLVEPGPEFNVVELRGRLVMALRAILRINKIESFTADEQKVIIFYICPHIYLN